MIITHVTLHNSSTVLLIEDFFPENLLQKLLEICDSYPDQQNWKIPFGFDKSTLRRSYEGADLEPIKDWLKSDQCRSIIEEKIQKKISYSDLHLWCDPPGVGGLMPHKEQGGEYLAQIFITRKEHSYTGTTIYNDDGRLLIQLPYRNNFGWFFDKGTTVMHGREHPVPDEILRFSLLVWYGSEIGL